MNIVYSTKSLLAYFNALTQTLLLPSQMAWSVEKGMMNFVSLESIVRALSKIMTSQRLEETLTICAGQ